MGHSTTPECLDCGACCFGDRPDYVPVSGDDHARLGDAAEALTVFVGNRCFMRMHKGHCAALELRNGQYFCTTYEKRPEVCRTLGRGSPQCRAERDAKTERARAAFNLVFDT